MKSKKNRIVIAIALTLALAIGVGGIVFNQFIEKKTEYLSASWNYNYKDVEEIALQSDVIALVKVDGVKEILVQNDIPYTLFTVSVVTPVYNTNENDSFTIFMTGGDYNKKRVEIADDPLLEKGEVFLAFFTLNPDGTYQITGGPQGRLVYEDGKLSSLSPSNSKAHKENVFSNIKVENVDADLLIDEIRGYISGK